MDKTGGNVSVSPRHPSTASHWGSVRPAEIRQRRQQSAQHSTDLPEEAEVMSAAVQAKRRSVMEYCDEMTLSVETMPMPDFRPGVTTSIPNESVLDFMKTLAKEGSAKVFTIGFSKVFLSSPSQELLTSCFWYIFLHHFRSDSVDVFYFKHLQLDLMSAHYRSTFFLASEKEKDIILQRYPDIAAQTLYAMFYGCFPFSRNAIDESFRKLLLMACAYWFTGRKLFNPSVMHWQQQKVLQQVMSLFEKELEHKKKRVTQFFDYSEIQRENAELGVGTSTGIFVAGSKHGSGRGAIRMDEIRQDFRDLYSGDRLDKCNRRYRKEETVQEEKSFQEEVKGEAGLERKACLLMNPNPVWIDDDMEDQASVSDNQFQLCGTSPLVRRYIALTSRLTSSIVAKNSLEEFNASLKLPNLEPEYDELIMKGLVDRSAYSVLHSASHIQDGVSPACYYASAMAARLLNDSLKKRRTLANDLGPRAVSAMPSTRSAVSYLQRAPSAPTTRPSSGAVSRPTAPLPKRGERYPSAHMSIMPPRAPSQSIPMDLSTTSVAVSLPSSSRSTSCPPVSSTGPSAGDQLPLLTNVTDIRRPSSASHPNPERGQRAVGSTFMTDLEVEIPHEGQGAIASLPYKVENPMLSFSAERKGQVSGKAQGDYRRTFRGLENPASCQRVAKYTKISHTDLQEEIQQPDPGYTAAAHRIVRHSKRIQSRVDPESSRLEIVQRNRIGEYHKSQILATSEERKMISRQRQAAFNGVRRSLAIVLEALQDLKRLERSDPTDLQLIIQYKELIRVMDEQFPSVPAAFRSMFQEFWAVKLPKLRIMVGYYKAHHKAQLVQELKGGNTATLDLLMLPDEVERFQRQQDGMVDVSQVKSKVGQSQANSMRGIVKKKQEIADRAKEKMIQEGAIQKPSMHDLQRDAQERRALRHQMAYRRQLEMKLGFRVDFDEWDNGVEEEEEEEADDTLEENSTAVVDAGDAVLDRTIWELVAACQEDGSPSERSPASTHAPSSPTPWKPKSILKQRAVLDRSAAMSGTLSPAHEAIAISIDFLHEPPNDPEAPPTAVDFSEESSAVPTDDQPNRPLSTSCNEPPVSGGQEGNSTSALLETGNQPAAPQGAKGDPVPSEPRHSSKVDGHATSVSDQGTATHVVDGTVGTSEVESVGPSTSFSAGPVPASPTAPVRESTAELLGIGAVSPGSARRPSLVPPSLQAIADLENPECGELRDLERMALLRLGVKEFEFGGVAVFGNSVMWTNTHKLLSESADEMLVSLRNRKKAKNRSYGLETAPLV
eukprot:GGOE01017835.1.p1 GENE.GGOE01017835.1~~GGOE01017835.1.p1  ORF type:complete len:1283 (-),score=306.41 GGOE01017835.1:13-3861(-)